MKLPNLKKCSDTDLATLHESLLDELNKRRINQNYLAKKVLNINGITTKDFAVTYADWVCPPDDPRFKPTFSFSIKRGRKSYCIYYDFNYEKPHKWWPTRPSGYLPDGVTAPMDAEVENAAGDFIPDGFSESCENSYEYEGTTEEAIECLKKHGFTDIKNVQRQANL